VYVNPALDQFWIIDYRIYDPEGDGKTKLDHVQDMLANCVYQKNLLFRFVLMDSWYATKEIMLFIEKVKRIYYCPLKDNRQVDDLGAFLPYRRMDGLQWSDAEKEQGKIVKLKGFPKEHKVKLFRVVLSSQRRTMLLPTILLRTICKPCKRCAPCVGKLSNFTARPSNSPDRKVANVARLELSVITLDVRSWCGSGSSKSLMKRNVRFIKSNMVCCPITYVNN